MKNLTRILVLCLWASARLYAQAPQITQIEYFIDDVDPGFGQANQLSFTPGSMVNETFNVDVSSAGGGLHFLKVRVKDDSAWSLTHTISFYSISAITPLISKLEYFIDTDPGFGAGTNVPISADSIVNTNFIVNTSSTPAGLHTLYIRAKETNGTWSLTHAMPFIVVSGDAVNNITEMEYFFNADPGFGNGIPVSITPGTMVSEAFAVSTSALPTGVHTLHIRMKDSAGQWSHTRSFPIINIATGNPQITKLEYFYDSDPGLGAGTSVAITPGTSLTTTFTADVNSLSNGVHTLNVRTMDEGGTWGLTHSRPLIIGSTGVANITEAEYFFDSDPGFGSGSSVAITPGLSVSTAFVADVSSLSNGIHNFYFRTRDASGSWSLSHTFPLIIGSAGSVNVTEAEYFFDTDPGFGSGTPVAITPGTSVSTTFAADVSSLPTGLHTFNMRTKDATGGWSLTHALAFTKINVGFPDVTQIEYFFDSDPGFGLATPVLFTPGPSVSIAFSADVSSLSPGYHSLKVRAKDASGSWSFVHTNSFVLVKDVGNVVAIEYAVDSDPGIGSGTLVTVSPSASIMESIIVPADTLQEGNHKIFIRAKDSNGYWGITQTLEFEVCNIATPVSNVTDLTTNSFRITWDSVATASGYELDVSTDNFATFVSGFENKPVADTTALVSGLLANTSYQYRLRSQGSCLSVQGDTVTVMTYPESVAADSLVLVQFYNDTDGANWTNNSNWLSGPVATWHGVTLNQGGWVSALVLPNNGVNGTVPVQISQLDSLGYLDLSGNSLVQLPDLSAMITLTDLNIANNSLTFEDIEPNVGIANFSYSPQSAIGVGDTITLYERDELYLQYTVGGASNFYQWQLDGVDVGGETSNTLQREAHLSDNGMWRLKITNSVATGLVLYTTPVEVIVNPCSVPTVTGVASDVTTNSFKVTWGSEPLATTYELDVSLNTFSTFVSGYENKVVSDTTETVSGLDPGQTYQFRLRARGVCVSVNSDTVSVTTYEQGNPADSLVLVTFYNATDGPNWTNDSNWLTGPLATWEGVSLDMGRVSGLALPANGLKGNAGALADLDSLISIDVGGNIIEQLPDLSNLLALSSLNVANNRLTFEDLEPNAGIPGFIYSPQAEIGVADTVNLVEGQELFLQFTAGGTANVYQWQKDGSNVPGETSNTIQRPAVFPDNGVWRLAITNTIATGLQLYSRPVLVMVEQIGIEGDSLALVDLFNATGGSSWTVKTNWLTGNVSTWSGVGVTGNDVTTLNLANNNLQGAVPASLTTLYDITAIDLSGNSITALPNLTSLSSLTSLNVSGNNLQFESLEPNISIAGFNYASQKPIGVASSLEVRVHTSQQITATAGGSNNIYQWKLNGTNIEGATASSFTITDALRPAMGQYVCAITNSVVPNLTLSTQPVSVFVVADISGTLYSEQATAATAGKVYLFKITTTGAFDTIPAVDILNTGAYMFENVVIGQYLILGLADRALYPRALPTYYANKLYWEEADTVFLEDHTTGRDILTQLEPVAQPTGQGVINGFVVDLENHPHPHGRTEAPKRVANAAVSARRVETSGRGKEEVLTLVEYGFTDENGEFEFANLPEAEYRMNIQYPGFLMDVNSEIDITVGSNLEAEKRIEAVIADDKISVRVLVVTSIWTFEDYAADVYPNPTQNAARIQFESASTDRNVKMTDVTSRTVLEQSANEKDVVLDLRSLATGIYFIHVKDGGSLVKTLRLEIQ